MLPRREADLDASDPFLPLVLGVVSLATRLDHALAMAPEGPSRPAPEPSRALVPEDDATIHLLLGIIALRRGLSSHLPAVSEGACADAATPGADVRLSIPGRALLR